MPEGTPLFAVADAVVLTAGLEAPHFCPQLNRTVQALLVQLVHTAPTGESYVSVYGHLSRVDVQEGVSISEGTVIGLSGNTGCRGTPHLHFGVARNVAGRYVLIDPYGWHAPTEDRNEHYRPCVGARSASEPRARICCRVVSPKTSLMPRSIPCSPRSSMPRPRSVNCGFDVSIDWRFACPPKRVL